MPLGLSCALATFQRLMKVMKSLQWETGLIYLNGIIVIGKRFEDMIQNWRTMFDRLLDAGLKLKAKKCTVFAQKVLYLDHVISEGIYTDPEKVKIVRNWPEPCDVSEVCSFLGLFGYSLLKEPSLWKSLEKGCALKWTKESGFDINLSP